MGAVAAAVGGYTGSLAGTAGGLPGEGEGTNKIHPRQARLMLAVRMANANDKQQIIDCLRQHGAEDIEIAKGQKAERVGRDRCLRIQTCTPESSIQKILAEINQAGGIESCYQTQMGRDSADLFLGSARRRS